MTTIDRKAARFMIEAGCGCENVGKQVRTWFPSPFQLFFSFSPSPPFLSLPPSLPPFLPYRPLAHQSTSTHLPCLSPSLPPFRNPKLVSVPFIWHHKGPAMWRVNA